jgi:hypothetical protein
VHPGVSDLITWSPICARMTTGNRVSARCSDISRTAVLEKVHHPRGKTHGGDHQWKSLRKGARKQHPHDPAEEESHHSGKERSE